MKINLNTLFKPIIIDQDFEIPEEYYKKMGISEIKDVHAVGKVFYNLADEIEIDLDVKGVMVLEDAISLDAIDYPFSFKIEENLTENDEFNEKNKEIDKNVLDIILFLWENIVLEVPISVTNCKDKKLSGDGWQLNGQESNEEINQEMSKLNDLLKGGEKTNGSSF